MKVEVGIHADLALACILISADAAAAEKAALAANAAALEAERQRARRK